MRFPLGRLILLASVSIGAGCGPFFARGRSDQNVITEDQIHDNRFQNAYQAVESLHSNWLNLRPNTILGAQDSVWVYYDNIKVGFPRELLTIESQRINYIRYYDAVSATTRWGVGHSQGVIFVSSRPPDETSN